MKGKSQNVPDHPPAPGYICYRCGNKGHWIQACPTNDDPSFDGRPRVKRTTGIPRSFLKTVQKPIALVNDGTVDDSKQPSGVMVNAEGEWVVAEPDQATWDQYQAKAKVSAAAQDAAARGSKELQDRGLECTIDKHLFANPTKTPCCQTTFCHDCITNALIDNDLRCPECSIDNVLMDDLTPDTDMATKIRSYEEERSNGAPNIKSPKNTAKEESFTTPEPSKSPRKDEGTRPKSPPKGPKADEGRKRPADSDLQSERNAPGRRDVIEGKTDNNTKSQLDDQKKTTPNNATLPQFPFMDPNFLNGSAMNPMGLPNMNGFMGMPMSMGPPMGMNATMQNPMMMAPFMGNDWNNMWTGGFPQHNMQNTNMGSGGFQRPNGGYSQQQNNNGMGIGFSNVNGMGMNGAAGSFANQQRTSFGTPSNNGEDSAYFRKPVNPHRHQGRRNLNRPADYREI